jgi:7-carboxy-7-deazaguanine synthase
MRIAEIFRSLQGEGRLTGVDSIFVRISGCNLRCGYCDTPYASWSPEGDDLSVDEIVNCVEELRREKTPEFVASHSLHLVHRSGNASVSPSRLSEGSTIEECIVSAEIGKLKTEVRHIVLTGGEPMLFAELIPLTTALHNNGWHITIETAGTLDLPVTCDLMSISPKLSNSIPPAERDPRWTWRHTVNRHAPHVIRRLLSDYDYQLKFVVDSPEDCEEAESYLKEFPEVARSHVMLMPQGVDADALGQKALWLEPYCEERGYTFCPRRHVEWFGSQRGR